MIKTLITNKLNFFYYRYKGLVLTLIVILMASSLGLQGVNFVKTGYMFSSSESMPTTATMPLIKTNLNSSDFLPVFGKADEIKQFIPATSLNLKLKGVLSGTGYNASSSAIIQGGDGTEDLYKQGEKLPGGATLEKIEANAVIIRYLGNLQKIFFIEERTTSALISAKRSDQWSTTQASHFSEEKPERRQKLINHLATSSNKMQNPINLT